MNAEAVVFAAAKMGSSDDEWEDGAAGGPGPLAPGYLSDSARYIVVDGATEAFDSIRWVDLIVSSFIDGSTAPAITPPGLEQWFSGLQQRWEDEAPSGLNYFEEQKFAQGSFATLLCCEIAGLGGPTPMWHAASLGDTVLFHVREGRLIHQFPAMQAEEFGTNPDGVHTSTAHLEQMMGSLSFNQGHLVPGDQLFIATDAFAHWMLDRAGEQSTSVWDVLTNVHHPSVFRAMVDEQRESGAMTNDDVTLVRLRLETIEPEYLVVCLP
jgi:hypothetical protein